METIDATFPTTPEYIVSLKLVGEPRASPNTLFCQSPRTSDVHTPSLASTTHDDEFLSSVFYAHVDTPTLHHPSLIHRRARHPPPWTPLRLLLGHPAVLQHLHFPTTGLHQPLRHSCLWDHPYPALLHSMTMSLRSPKPERRAHFLRRAIQSHRLHRRLRWAVYLHLMSADLCYSRVMFHDQLL